MGQKKQKYYVVWQGLHTGIFSTWEECQKEVKGIKGAQYKSFDTKEEAVEAFHHSYDEMKGCKKESDLYVDENGMTQIKNTATVPPILDSLAVDAACSGNPGVMEYQGVYVMTRTQVFHYKSPVGTNNIGEFLGIVHGLSYLKKHHLKQVLYSDSVNAINWVKQKKCKSNLPLNEKTQALWDYIHRAEAWLEQNSYTTEIRKWNTDQWGEIPADFNRKH